LKITTKIGKDFSFRYGISKEIKEYTDGFLSSNFNLIGIF